MFYKFVRKEFTPETIHEYFDKRLTFDGAPCAIQIGVDGLQYSALIIQCDDGEDVILKFKNVESLCDMLNTSECGYYEKSPGQVEPRVP